MINKVILTGRLTRDIEIRRTNDGTPYTFFTLAVNKRFGNDQTDFVPCVAWRKTAELMENYLNKGALIGVEGTINVFTKRDNGNFETRVNVQVENITFLESRSQSTERTQEKSFSNNNNNQKMTFSNEPSFDQSDVTPPPEEDAFSKPEEVNANNINLDEIKF